MHKAECHALSEHKLNEDEQPRKLWKKINIVNLFRECEVKTRLQDSKLYQKYLNFLFKSLKNVSYYRDNE